MTTTPNLALKQLDSPPAIDAELDVNASLRQLDALCHLAVKDRDLSAPPGSPADGDRYLVAASPTGAWTGKAGKIAIYIGTAWAFQDVREGMRLWVNDEDVLLVYDGAAYRVIGTQAAAVADLSGSPTTTDLKNKVNDLLAKLRASGLLAP